MDLIGYTEEKKRREEKRRRRVSERGVQEFKNSRETG
jgi:hypothetical protein